MPLTIRSEEVARLADKLASVAGVSKTEAVQLALVNELGRREETLEAYLARLRPLQERLAALPSTGAPIDNVFYDSLNDGRCSSMPRPSSRSCWPNPASSASPNVSRPANAP